MSEKEALPEPTDGRIYMLFRPKGTKLFSAHIVLPGGAYKEVFESGTSDRGNAIGITNGRVRRLYKDHKIESPGQYKKRTGSRLTLSSIRRALAMGQVPDESEAPAEDARPRRSNGVSDEHEHEHEHEHEQTAAPPDTNWERNVVRIETKFSQGFQRIMNIMLLGVGNDDPVEFREHVRAIVAEVALSGLTPTGKLMRKRGRPPGA